jgi:hypothetical protein
MVSSAEQPGASSAMSPATQHLSFDILLASQRCNELDKNFLRPKPPSKSDPMQQRPKEAFVRVAGMVQCPAVLAWFHTATTTDVQYSRRSQL